MKNSSILSDDYIDYKYFFKNLLKHGDLCFMELYHHTIIEVVNNNLIAILNKIRVNYLSLMLE